MTTVDVRRGLAATGKYTSLIVASIAILLPLVVVVLTSLKTKEDYWSWWSSPR